MSDRDRLDPVDLLIFAPIGMASRLQDDLPELIEAGRRRVDTEITTARSIGMLAVGQLRRRFASPSGTPARRPSSPRSTSSRRSAGTPTTTNPVATDATTTNPVATEATAKKAAAKKTAAKKTAAKKTAAKKTAAKKTAAKKTAAARSVSGTGELPIEEYDSLSAVQVLPRLASLDAGELNSVEAYESANRGRRTILHRIEQLRARA